MPICITLFTSTFVVREHLRQQRLRAPMPDTLSDKFLQLQLYCGGADNSVLHNWTSVAPFVAAAPALVPKTLQIATYCFLMRATRTWDDDHLAGGGAGTAASAGGHRRC